ncbi:hypothetical protein C8F01DRAFT_985939 [Mycena amicta]|nr:hypothetical protein C8F01DRAFT_985939 [Mycena amicta]
MATFDCDGWLDVWASPDDFTVYARIRHQECHAKYVCIELPDDVKEYIKDHPQMTLWKAILEVHPLPNFKYYSVYNFYIKLHQHRWRHDDDELKSAKALMEMYGPDSQHELEAIALPDNPDDGCVAIAFAFPRLVKKWSGVIREIAQDSTFKTTHSGYECFAILGEVGGSGLPLGILLLKSKNPEPNAKERYLRSFIRHFLDKHQLRVRQCLTDKDITEINALLAELPADVKYQVCFWHAIRIVKGRLCVLARRPAPYDAEEAFGEFDWIDRSFLPVAQMDPRLRTKVFQFPIRLREV